MASISPTTALATFQASSSRASSSRLPHVALSEVVGSGGALALAAVQGDGVWTYDLQTLRPVTSFTVHPSTVFTTRPVSYFTSPRRAAGPAKTVKDKQKARNQGLSGGDMDVDDVPVEAQQTFVPERITAIGAVRVEGSSTSDGQEVWVWRGEEGAEKEVLELKSSTSIQTIHHLSSPEHPLLVISTSGPFYLLDPTFVPRALDSPAPGNIIASRIIGSSTHHSQLVLVGADGHVSLLKLEHANVEVQLVSQGRLREGDEDVSLVAADISDDGIVTAIDAENNVITRDARSLQAPMLSSHPRLLHPSSLPVLLALTSSSRPLVLVPSASPPSLLLATVTPEMPAVLIASSLASLSASGSISHLAILARPSPTTFVVGFVLSHVFEGKPGRSVVYTCEVTLPEKGIGLNALLGTQAMTDLYLASASRSAADAVAPKTFETSCREVVERIRAALQAEGDIRMRAQNAEETFSRWIAEEEDKRPSEGKLVLPATLAGRVLNVVFSAALPQRASTADMLPDEASTETTQTGPYAAGIVRNMLHRGLVSDSMWPGGVVAAGFIPCGDWSSIRKSLRSIPSLAPSAYIRALLACLQPSSNALIPAPDFKDLYRDVLAVPPPPTSYRVEMRRLVGVEDAVVFLECLVGWAAMHVESNGGLAGWDGGKSQPAVVPSLDAVITHSSLLLDSHLPLFLSHPPSHSLLERLQVALDPLISLQNYLRQLRAPIEAVLLLAKREERRRDERREKREALKPVSSAGAGAAGKNGKGKKADPEIRRAYVSLGGGARLPGEAIGKWRVEDIIF